jgi:hypothetical protein
VLLWPPCTILLHNRCARALTSKPADLESVFYIVAELALGGEKLPWAGRYVETEGADGRSSLSDGVCTGEFISHSFDGAHTRCAACCMLPHGMR